MKTSRADVCKKTVFLETLICDFQEELLTVNEYVRTVSFRNVPAEILWANPITSILFLEGNLFASS